MVPKLRRNRWGGQVRVLLTLPLLLVVLLSVQVSRAAIYLDDGTAGTVPGATDQAAVRPSVLTETCPATRVNYQRNRDAGTGLSDLPWIAAGRGPTRIVGYLFSYLVSLSDRRFNESSRLVLPYGGRSSGAAAPKILWIPRGAAGPMLVISGRRLDGPGSFSQSEPVASGGFPSIVEIPSAGCWELTLATGNLRVPVVVQAVEPHETGCDATRVRHETNPRLGVPGPWISATPTSAQLYGQGSVVTDAGDTASIYAGGRRPDGASTNVLWIAKGKRGALLEILGTRFDGPREGPGWFRQRVRMAAQRAGHFPSVLNIPTPGCWLLTVRTGAVAGIVVYRAIAP